MELLPVSMPLAFFCDVRRICITGHPTDQVTRLHRRALEHLSWLLFLSAGIGVYFAKGVTCPGLHWLLPRRGSSPRPPPRPSPSELIASFSFSPPPTLGSSKHNIYYLPSVSNVSTRRVIAPRIDPLNEKSPKPSARTCIASVTAFEAFRTYVPKWPVSRARCPRTSSPPPRAAMTMASRGAIMASLAATWQVPHSPVFPRLSKGVAHLSRLPSSIHDAPPTTYRRRMESSHPTLLNMRPSGGYPPPGTPGKCGRGLRLSRHA